MLKSAHCNKAVPGHLSRVQANSSMPLWRHMPPSHLSSLRLKLGKEETSLGGFKSVWIMCTTF